MKVTLELSDSMIQDLKSKSAELGITTGDIVRQSITDFLFHHPSKDCLISGQTYTQQLLNLFNLNPVRTSLEISQALGSICPGSCVSELRKWLDSQGLRHRIECRYLSRTSEGKKIYQYTFIPDSTSEGLLT